MSQTICSKCTIIVDEIYSIINKYQQKQQCIIQQHKNQSKQLEIDVSIKTTENRDSNLNKNVKNENTVGEVSKDDCNSLLNELNVEDENCTIEYYWRTKMICLFCGKYFVTQTHMEKHLLLHESLIKLCEDLSTPCFVGLQKLPFNYKNNEKKVNFFINPYWVHFDEKNVLKFDVNKKYFYSIRERNLRRKRKRCLESETEGDYSSDVSSKVNDIDNKSVRKEEIPASKISKSENQLNARKEIPASKIGKIESQLNVHAEKTGVMQEKAPISSKCDISTNQKDVGNQSQDSIKNEHQDVGDQSQDSIGNKCQGDVIMLDNVETDTVVSSEVHIGITKLKSHKGPIKEADDNLSIAISNVVVNGNSTTNFGQEGRSHVEKVNESTAKILCSHFEIYNEVKQSYMSEQNKKNVVANSKAKMFYDMLESKNLIDVVWVPTMDDVVKKSPSLSLKRNYNVVKKNQKNNSLLVRPKDATNKPLNNAMVLLPDTSNGNYCTPPFVKVTPIPANSDLSSTGEKQTENININEEPSTSNFSPKIVSSFTLQCNGLQSKHSLGSNLDENKTLKSNLNTSNEKCVKNFENINSNNVNKNNQKTSEIGSSKSNANNICKETKLPVVVKPVIKCKPTELLMPNNQQLKTLLDNNVLSDSRLNDPNMKVCNNQGKLIFPPPLAPIQLHNNVVYSVPICDIDSSSETNNGAISCPKTFSTTEALQNVAGNNVYDISENGFKVIQNYVPRPSDSFLSILKQHLLECNITLQQLSNYKNKNMIQNNYSMSHLLHLLVRFKITMNTTSDLPREKNYFVNMFVDHEGVLILNCTNSQNASEDIESWSNGFQKQLFKAFGDKCIADIITKAATQFTLFIEKVLGFLSVIKQLLNDV